MLLLGASLLASPAQGLLPAEEAALPEACVAGRVCLGDDPCESVAACGALPCDVASVACGALPCDVASASCGTPTPCGADDCHPPEPPRNPGVNACHAGATSFSFRLSTGERASGASLTSGAVDPLWKATASGLFASGIPGPAFAKSRSDAPLHWPQHATARWINGYPGGMIDEYGSQHDYAATFTIPPQAYQVSITGGFAAAKAGSISLGPTTYSSAFNSWTGISWTNVPPGVHTLRADLWSLLWEPTGLLVDATVTGLCDQGGATVGMSACSGGARSFHYKLSTGVGPTGAPLSDGTDPHWTVVTPTGYYGPAWSRGVSPILPYGAWVSNSASAWINHSPIGVEGYAGTYVYRVNYYVPANAYDVEVTGLFAADNEVEIDSIGNLQSTPLGAAASSGSAWHSLTPHSPGAGHHVLEARVLNYQASWTSINPTGLNMQVSVRGLCNPWLTEDVWHALG